MEKKENLFIDDYFFELCRFQIFFFNFKIINKIRLY